MLVVIVVSPRSNISTLICFCNNFVYVLSLITVHLSKFRSNKMSQNVKESTKQVQTGEFMMVV